MKKITSEAIAHFYSAMDFKKSNMEVIALQNVTVLKLFGNEIAYLYNDPERTLSITNAGYFTTTTKERLNGLRGVTISQKNGVWYLNDAEWNGKLTDIK
jgi:hypothetical protein